jgi:hypothetical protein
MTNIKDKDLRFAREGGVRAGLGLVPVQVMAKRVTVADLDAEATSQVIDFDEALPAGSILMGIGHRVDELADDGESINAATLDVGVTGSNADRFVDARDILVGSGSTGYVREDPTAPGDDSDDFPLPLSAETQLSILITTQVDVDTLVALDLTVYAAYFCLEDPEA